MEEACLILQVLVLLQAERPRRVVPQVVAAVETPCPNSLLLVPAAIELGSCAATSSHEAFPRHGPLGGRHGVQPLQRPSAPASMRHLESGWDASGVGSLWAPGHLLASSRGPDDAVAVEAAAGAGGRSLVASQNRYRTQY